MDTIHLRALVDQNQSSERSQDAPDQEGQSAMSRPAPACSTPMNQKRSEIQKKFLLSP
jgi:hypothetical protein